MSVRHYRFGLCDGDAEVISEFLYIISVKCLLQSVTRVHDVHYHKQ
jgi:hypothetical protein